MSTTHSNVHTVRSRSQNRQVFWQIVFPLLLLTIGLLALMVFLITGGKGQIRLLADIAMIALLLPLLILALLGILALGVAITLLSRLPRSIRPYAQQAQKYTAQGRLAIQKAADLIVRPIFWIGQGSAIVRQIARMLLGEK